MLNAKIVILVTLGLGSAAPSGLYCKAGSMWKEECNTCICTAQGEIKCTTLNCHPDAYHITSTLGRCKPLSRWRVDCNHCTCSEYGDMSCTTNICAANELNSERFKRQVEPTLPSRDACKPGVAWKDDCNRCFCRENGKAECTNLLCFPLDMPERRKREVDVDKDVERASWNNAFDYDESEQKPECVPGSNWYDEQSCNDCYCSSKGIRVCSNIFNEDCVPEKYGTMNGSPTYQDPKYQGLTDQGSTYPGLTNEGLTTNNVPTFQGSPYPDLTSQSSTNPDPTYQRLYESLPIGDPKITDRWMIPRNQGAGVLGPFTDIRVRRMACTEGDSWDEGCNKCHCTTEGTPACTKKRCLPEDWQKSEGVEKREASDYWKVGCNTCHCSKNGTPACTRKLCAPDERINRESTCKEGETWKQGCNSCYCSKEGTPACTKKLCTPEEDALGKRYNRKTKCTPGSTWKLDCNTCHCTDNGEAACTLMGCLSQTQYYPGKPKREVKKCQPGKKWKDDCNDCVCTHTGYPSCTLKACDSQTYILPNRKTREVKKCQPGKKWKDDCNDCVCTHTGYPSCTLKACDSQTYILPNRKTREVKKCQPGKKWKDDCNDCVCTHTGYPSCTLKACDSQTYILPNRKTREVKKCQPGKKWKDDCNDCVCTHTGYPSCTLKACDSQTYILPNRKTRDIKKCQPGSSWKEDCNNCFCSANGEEACTLKFCPNEDGLPIVRQKRQTKTACKPGSKRKEGCNTCTCLANGTEACTRKLCRRRRDTAQDVRECRPAAKMCGSTSSALDSQAKKKEGGKLRGRGRCTPGSTWIQNCIQCYCDEQQNVECVPEESCSDDQVASQSRNKEEGPKGRGRCEPGSTWEIASRRGDWCNFCTCDAVGTMNCSIRPCQKIENTSTLESETRKKRSTLPRRRSDRWCKPGDINYFTCNVCPCGVKGITGCSSRTCRD